MAHLNENLVLDQISLTTDWVALVTPVICNTIELTGDQQWYWCTDRDNGVVRKVEALVREQLIETRWDPGATSPRAFFYDNTPVCWVKGEQAGTLYRKFTR